MNRFMIAACCLGFVVTSQAQTEPHWEDLVVFGAGYMGPNALPVPFMNMGRINNQNELQLSTVAYFSEGEQTYNVATRANLALVEDLVSFDLFWVPVEYFQMSDEIRETRVVLPVKGDQKFAIGDVYLNSTVQILSLPEFSLAARAGFKFPSSNGVALSRFTDSPGYNLDLGACWDLLEQNSSGASLELQAMAGFYSYQTQGGYANYRQNDALLFGLSIDYQSGFWRAILEARGYLGYFDLRDQPVLIRAHLDRSFQRGALFFALQMGVNDLRYLSPEAGIRLFFPPVKVGYRHHSPL